MHVILVTKLALLPTILTQSFLSQKEKMDLTVGAISIMLPFLLLAVFHAQLSIKVSQINNSEDYQVCIKSAENPANLRSIVEPVALNLL